MIKMINYKILSELCRKNKGNIHYYNCKILCRRCKLYRYCEIKKGRIFKYIPLKIRNKQNQIDSKPIMYMESE